MTLTATTAAAAMMKRTTMMLMILRKEMAMMTDGNDDNGLNSENENNDEDVVKESHNLQVRHRNVLESAPSARLLRMRSKNVNISAQVRVSHFYQNISYTTFHSCQKRR